jgi:hypothetical protein
MYIIKVKVRNLSGLIQSWLPDFPSIHTQKHTSYIHICMHKHQHTAFLISFCQIKKYVVSCNSSVEIGFSFSKLVIQKFKYSSNLLSKKIQPNQIID